MKSVWQTSDRNDLLARIDRIAPATTPKWGRMTAERMLSHLVESAKMATGELTCRSKKLPLRFFPLKQLVLYVLPFPKSSPTAPELLAGAAAPVDALQRDLHRLLGDFASRDVRAAWPEHPAFGSMDGRQWGVLTYKHFDHHLRQFGV